MVNSESVISLINTNVSVNLDLIITDINERLNVFKVKFYDVLYNFYNTPPILHGLKCSKLNSSGYNTQSGDSIDKIVIKTHPPVWDNTSSDDEELNNEIKSKFSNTGEQLSEIISYYYKDCTAAPEYKSIPITPNEFKYPNDADKTIDGVKVTPRQFIDINLTRYKLINIVTKIYKNMAFGIKSSGTSAELTTYIDNIISCFKLFEEANNLYLDFCNIIHPPPSASSASSAPDSFFLNYFTDTCIYLDSGTATSAGKTTLNYNKNKMLNETPTVFFDPIDVYIRSLKKSGTDEIHNIYLFIINLRIYIQANLDLNESDNKTTKTSNKLSFSNSIPNKIDFTSNVKLGVFDDIQTLIQEKKKKKIVDIIAFFEDNLKTYLDKIYKLSILFSKPTLLQTKFTQNISNSINNMFISFIDFDNHVQIIYIKDLAPRKQGTYTGGTPATGTININSIMRTIFPTLTDVGSGLNSITYFNDEIISTTSEYNTLFDSPKSIEQICDSGNKYSRSIQNYSKQYMKFRTGGLYDIVEGTSCFEWIKIVYSKIKEKIPQATGLEGREKSGKYVQVIYDVLSLFLKAFNKQLQQLISPYMRNEIYSFFGINYIPSTIKMIYKLFDYIKNEISKSPSSSDLNTKIFSTFKMLNDAAIGIKTMINSLIDQAFRHKSNIDNFLSEIITHCGFGNQSEITPYFHFNDQTSDLPKMPFFNIIDFLSEFIIIRNTQQLYSIIMILDRLLLNRQMAPITEFGENVFRIQDIHENPVVLYDLLTYNERREFDVIIERIYDNKYQIFSDPAQKSTLEKNRKYIIKTLKYYFDERVIKDFFGIDNNKKVVTNYILNGYGRAIDIRTYTVKGLYDTIHNIYNIIWAASNIEPTLDLFGKSKTDFPLLYEALPYVNFKLTPYTVLVALCQTYFSYNARLLTSVFESWKEIVLSEITEDSMINDFLIPNYDEKYLAKLDLDHIDIAECFTNNGFMNLINKFGKKNEINQYTSRYGMIDFILAMFDQLNLKILPVLSVDEPILNINEFHNIFQLICSKELVNNLKINKGDPDTKWHLD